MGEEWLARHRFEMEDALDEAIAGANAQETSAPRPDARMQDRADKRARGVRAARAWRDEVGRLREVVAAEAAEQLLSAQEEERHRIALELHDSTSQHLAALGLGVTRLRRLVEAEPAAGVVLDDMAQSLHEAVREIRVLSFLMNPPDLERDALENTVRRFLNGFALRTGIAIKFSPQGLVDETSAAVRHAAFRVVQEALSNVHRHARASAVEVEMEHDAGVLSLRVADNGKGIHALQNGDAGWAPLGVGVAGMRARVRQLGGAIEITSDARGTVVRARLPVGAEDSWRRPS